MTHQLYFHFTGSLFDKKGNLKNWWDEKSLVGFVNREGCLVKEYQHYTVLGRHVSHLKAIICLIYIRTTKQEFVNWTLKRMAAAYVAA